MTAKPSVEQLIAAWQKLDLPLTDLRSMSYVVECLEEDCMVARTQFADDLAKCALKAPSNYRVIILTTEQYEGFSFAITQFGRMARDLEERFRDLSKEVEPSCC